MYNCICHCMYNFVHTLQSPSHPWRTVKSLWSWYMEGTAEIRTEVDKYQTNGWPIVYKRMRTQLEIHIPNEESSGVTHFGLHHLLFVEWTAALLKRYTANHQSETKAFRTALFPVLDSNRRCRYSHKCGTIFPSSMARFTRRVLPSRTQSLLTYWDVGNIIGAKTAIQFQNFIAVLLKQ